MSQIIISEYKMIDPANTKHPKKTIIFPKALKSKAELETIHVERILMLIKLVKLGLPWLCPTVVIVI